MIPTWLPDLLLQAGGAAPADPAAGAPADPLAFFKSFPFIMLLIVAIFYFLVIRPDGRKRKEREQRAANIKKGDTVITTGGIIARVWRVDQKEVTLIIDKDKEVKAHFQKNAILDILSEPPAGGKAGSEEPAKEAEERAKA